jgi:hypothetical protein
MPPNYVPHNYNKNVANWRKGVASGKYNIAPKTVKNNVRTALEKAGKSLPVTESKNINAEAIARGNAVPFNYAAHGLNREAILRGEPIRYNFLSASQTQTPAQKRAAALAALRGKHRSRKTRRSRR